MIIVINIGGIRLDVYSYCYGWLHVILVTVIATRSISLNPYSYYNEWHYVRWLNLLQVAPGYMFQLYSTLLTAYYRRIFFIEYYALLQITTVICDKYCTLSSQDFLTNEMMYWSQNTNTCSQQYRYHCCSHIWPTQAPAL